MRYSIYGTDAFPLLSIDNIGLSDDVNITKFGPIARDEYVIIYILNGKGIFNNIPLTKGQGFIIPSGVSSEYYPDLKDPWTILWVTSCDKSIEYLFEYYHLDKKKSVFSFDFSDNLTSVIEFMEENNGKRTGRAEILELYMKILKLHKTEKKYSNLKTNESKYISYTLNYIYSNYYKDITVKDITAALGVSQPYLYKIFQKNLNTSPKQHIVEHRIKIAKNLLAETELSISVIAQSVGYSDVHNFSKIFRKKRGYSPQHYREMKRNHSSKQTQ